MAAHKSSSSAWLRVLSPMAGASHAMLFLPRIGDEVMVSFIQGDPDRPYVIGALYNASNQPPYALPANLNVSTIRSAGTDGHVNEIKLDDTAGRQVLSVQSAGDLLLNALGAVSINSGTGLTNLLAGQTLVGSCSTGSTNIAITFPRAFHTPPRILATPSNDPNWSNVNDTFAASVRNVSTTGCVLNIVRLDANTGWSQILRVNWWAWE